MKLAFNGEAHYPDFADGYELYKKRCRGAELVDLKTYKRIVKLYCKKLADRLEESGAVDLPNRMGSIITAMITRKPQYRGKEFVGYGAMDWKTGHFDGKLKAFALVFLPNRTKHECLRCYGFVANRRLFKRIKAKWMSDYCEWTPMEFNEEII